MTDLACVLVGCVSQKERTPLPAKDLYRSELFARRRAYAESCSCPWFIVSSQYGLVDPDQVVEPYELRINDLELDERRALGEGVAESLDSQLGGLAGQNVEVHAGEEYVQVLSAPLRSRGAILRRPLQGLRIGEQLAWYGAQGAATRSPSGTSKARPVPSQTLHGLALEITKEFTEGRLDLADGPGVPPAGWSGMPEVVVAERLRDAGAGDVDVRLMSTFTSAMDRARDADALWFAAERLFMSNPWTFVPGEVVERSVTDLADTLRTAGVSQRHGPDAWTWRVIAESLTGDTTPIATVIFDGQGDAPQLLESLQARTTAGTDLFPFLRGPKIGPMWVRIMAYPGHAEIASLDVLPVAVDVQVRKISEYLGVTDTGDLELDDARGAIQASWSLDVSRHGALGPEPLRNTAAALDPALWFWAKWGCTRCERARRRLPIGSVCERCRYPVRS